MRCWQHRSTLDLDGEEHFRGVWDSRMEACGSWGDTQEYVHVHEEIGGSKEAARTTHRQAGRD